MEVRVLFRALLIEGKLIREPFKAPFFVHWKMAPARILPESRGEVLKSVDLLPLVPTFSKLHQLESPQHVHADGAVAERCWGKSICAVCRG